MRIWLHEGHDGEPGVEAWAPDFLGFATWAESHAALHAKLPAKLREYRRWRERHGIGPAPADLARVRTLELPYGREDWSVRKSLRRLVAHERQHTKSIARITRAFAAEPRNPAR